MTLSIMKVKLSSIEKLVAETCIFYTLTHYNVIKFSNIIVILINIIHIKNLLILNKY